MLEKLSVHGFRTLIDTEIEFDQFTIMIGKNGVGKTTILDVLQLIGNHARGGVNRAFGPPPWSLSWQRSRDVGQVHAVRFELTVQIPDGQRYRYLLSVDEKNLQPQVVEERLTRLSDSTTVAAYSRPSPPASGTILSPEPTNMNAAEVKAVADIFRSVISYELNPSAIEQGTDPEHSHVSRDGFGVAGFLAHAKDDQAVLFAKLETRLKNLRPGTQAIDLWSSSGKTYWGLRDGGQQRAIPACHISWGDRQLVGLLCVLYGAKPHSTIAIEEIDRGFHPSRYTAVVELLSEAALDGLDNQRPLQIVATTHSPSFVNRLGDRLSEMRMVSRVPGGGTVVRPLQQVVNEKLGTTELDTPLGEVWETGLLEDVVAEAMH